MHKFLNLKYGVLSVGYYREPISASTTQEEIIKAFKQKSNEFLSAAIQNRLILIKNKDSWSAGYTGVNSDLEFVIEQARNIIAATSDEAILAASAIFGFDIDDVYVQIND